MYFSSYFYVLIFYKIDDKLSYCKFGYLYRYGARYNIVKEPLILLFVDGDELEF
jgi:hypothetical protein